MHYTTRARAGRSGRTSALMRNGMKPACAVNFVGRIIKIILSRETKHRSDGDFHLRMRHALDIVKLGGTGDRFGDHFRVDCVESVD